MVIDDPGRVNLSQLSTRASGKFAEYLHGLGSEHRNAIKSDTSQVVCEILDLQ
jgi:hypothetical protein